MERFHRRLKEALKTQENPFYWLDKLPLILLSIRTIVKEDISYSSDELMYGETLTLPGDLLVAKDQPEVLDYTQYVDRLKVFMQEVGHTQSRVRQVNKHHIDPKLLTATHVFVRNDAVKPPLTPPYKGPFPVISRDSKTFKLQINHNKTDTVSVDRLKTAHTEESFLVPNVTFREYIEVELPNMGELNNNVQVPREQIVAQQLEPKGVIITAPVATVPPKKVRFLNQNRVTRTRKNIRVPSKYINHHR